MKTITETFAASTILSATFDIGVTNSSTRLFDLIWTTTLSNVDPVLLTNLAVNISSGHLYPQVSGSYNQTITLSCPTNIAVGTYQATMHFEASSPTYDSYVDHLGWQVDNFYSQEDILLTVTKLTWVPALSVQVDIYKVPPWVPTMPAPAPSSSIVLALGSPYYPGVTSWHWEDTTRGGNYNLDVDVVWNASQGWWSCTSYWDNRDDVYFSGKKIDPTGASPYGVYLDIITSQFVATVSAI